MSSKALEVLALLGLKGEGNDDKSVECPPKLPGLRPSPRRRRSPPPAGEGVVTAIVALRGDDVGRPESFSPPPAPAPQALAPQALAPQRPPLEPWPEPQPPELPWLPGAEASPNDGVMGETCKLPLPPPEPPP